MERETITPAVGHRPNGTKYPWQVKTTMGQVMGGYETREAAADVAEMYNKQPRPKNRFEFVVAQA